MTTIYVGNLPLSWGEEELQSLFARFGQVVGVTLITDRESGGSRGFGFAEMESGAAAAAIAALDGEEFEDCVLRLNEARDRGARPPRREY